MKKTHLIGILVIAIAIAAIISTFSDSSSYASFAESKETNKEIHVVGKLQKEKEMIYNPIQDANYFSFYVKDQQGEECKVIYAGTKPQDFEKSEQIVLIGKMQADEFHASKIGVELDLDSVKDMPTSAYTPSGFSEEDIRKLLYKTRKEKDVLYYHFAEGAPLDPIQNSKVGKFLAYLVADILSINN